MHLFVTDLVPASENQRHILVRAGDGAHQLEECRLSNDASMPATLAMHNVETAAPVGGDTITPAVPTYLIAIQIEGASRWSRARASQVLPQSQPILSAPRGLTADSDLTATIDAGADECVLSRHQFVAFVAEPDLQITRTGSQPAHFFLWRFRMDAMHTIRTLLGHTTPSPASPPAGTPHSTSDNWPTSGPLPLTPDQQSLILSLRTAPKGPLQTLWYGAKLLEFLVLIHHPGTSSTAPAKDPAAPAPLRLHPAVERATAFIQNSFAQPLTLTGIARLVGISPTHLSHLFTTQLGEPLTSYLRRIRIEHAARLLEAGNCNVTEAAMAVGYSSLGQFSHTFRARFGHPPGKHRRR